MKSLIGFLAWPSICAPLFQRLARLCELKLTRVDLGSFKVPVRHFVQGDIVPANVIAILCKGQEVHTFSVVGLWSKLVPRAIPNSASAVLQLECAEWDINLDSLRTIHKDRNHTGLTARIN